MLLRWLLRDGIATPSWGPAKDDRGRHAHPYAKRGLRFGRPAAVHEHTMHAERKDERWSRPAAPTTLKHFYLANGGALPHTWPRRLELALQSGVSRGQEGAGGRCSV